MQSSASSIRQAVLALLFGLLTMQPVLGTAATGSLRKVSKIMVKANMLTSVSVPYVTSSSRLHTIVEDKLRSAGFRVISEKEDAYDRAINPYARLNVTVFPLMSAEGAILLYVYRTDLSVRIDAPVPLNGTHAPVELWQFEGMGARDKESLGPAIETEVSRLIDSLVNQWAKENAKR